MTEGYVQLPPDGAGKKLRTAQITQPGSDGTTTVMQDVAVVGDDRGTTLDLGTGQLPTRDDEVVETLRRIEQLLELMAGGDVGEFLGGSFDPHAPITARTLARTTPDQQPGSRLPVDRFGRPLVGHVDPDAQVWVSANPTTQQTGAALWTPKTGKKIAVTSLVVASYGGTPGRVIVWFGAPTDTNYDAGTDQLVLAASFAPGANSKPGAILQPSVPIFCTSYGFVLRITTDAGISLDVAAYGYEFG